MPASQVAKKFRKGKLHSGSKHGPVVTDQHQMKAIQISEARDEGHHIPFKSSKKDSKKSLAKSLLKRRK